MVPAPEKENNRLRVFGYPGTSKFTGSPVEKIITYLLSLDYWFEGPVMIQFWAPTITNSGDVVLVVSEQPFAIGELCKGLCRYRYSCIEAEEDVTNSKVGPIWKVFSRGFPEYRKYSEESLSSSDKEFAEACRIGDDWNYLAVPIFGRGNADKGQVKDCVEVLEVLSYGPNYYDREFIEESLKISGIDCILSHFLPRFVMKEIDSLNQEILRIRQNLERVADHHSKTAQTSADVLANAEAELALDPTPIGEEVEAVAETLDGELVRSHKMKGSNMKLQQLGTLETKDHLNLLDVVENSKKNRAGDEDEITLDLINKYRGRTKLADAAKELKVSRATLKRRCRKFGIKRWPHHKGNEVHNLAEVGGSVIQESDIRLCSNNDEAPTASVNHEIDRGYRLIVRARCRDDVAKFPFYSNSGIEELCRELVKRFELEVGKFKVKYEDEDDDGEWIIILSCNEDLLFHIETLKASGQSTMRLLVVPVNL